MTDETKRKLFWLACSIGLGIGFSVGFLSWLGR